MRLIGVLLILLLIADMALNQGMLFNRFKSLDYPLPILLQILYVVIAILSVALIIHAIIMEWNLLPKLKNKSSMFDELNSDDDKNSHKKEKKHE